jgi:hypothetical protein
MKPTIVINYTLNPQNIDFHLGFNIANQEAKLFAEIQDGEIKEAIEGSFQNLNLRGGFLLGRISRLKGIKRLSIDQDSLSVEIADNFSIPEIVDLIVRAIQFVVPPEIQNRARVFVDREYHILNKYNQPRD